jgi:hypothetical protein
MKESKGRQGPMEEKTSVLICLDAATAANCVPCFEHDLNKAKQEVQGDPGREMHL